MRFYAIVHEQLLNLYICDLLRITCHCNGRHLALVLGDWSRIIAGSFHRRIPGTLGLLQEVQSPESYPGLADPLVVGEPTPAQDGSRNTPETASIYPGTWSQNRCNVAWSLQTCNCNNALQVGAKGDQVAEGKICLRLFHALAGKWFGYCRE